MELDSWSLSDKVIDWLVENLKKGSSILELGSGLGTGELSKNFNMTSIEHNSLFLDKYDSNYIYAPIKNGWYDSSKLKGLPDYDCLIIDAPPSNIGRMGIMKNWNLFDWSKTIIVDDTHRKNDYILYQLISRKLMRREVTIKSEGKETKIILP